jgi:hypothetical protein
MNILYINCKKGYLLIITLVLLLVQFPSLKAQELLWTEDFEEAGADTYTSNTANLSGLSNAWSYEKTNAGRLRMSAGAAYSKSGTHAATLDVNVNRSLSENYITVVLDISNYSAFTNIALGFSYMDHGDEDNTNDKVWVRSGNDDSQPWVEVYDLVPEGVTNGNWNDVTGIDITTPLASQPASNFLQIRFGQQDNWPTTRTTGNDGITFDDITLSGYSVIWAEDFTYGNRTVTGQGSPAIATWSADGISGGLGIGVIGNQMRGRNTRDANPDRTNWSINVGDPIEISGFKDVKISVDISENSNLEASDYIQLQYSLDGGVWTNFDVNGYRNNEFTSAVATQSGLSGSTLRIQIIMYNNADAERYFADNIFVTGTPEVVNMGSGTSYYSYQSGNWDDAGTWTHDPGGTTQTATDIPNSGDFVVILGSRTVSLDSDVDTTNLDIVINEGAILDLSTFQFNNDLASLSGQGTLRLSSVNFPTVATNNFVNTGGGTTEYNNAANFTLPATQLVYNNLRLNASGVTATQLSNIDLNGDLHIKQGTYRINDNSVARRQLTINGSVLVDNGASITVGSGNTIDGDISGGTAPFTDYYDKQTHRVVVNGDFTNNGTVKFTNQNFPVFNAFPNNGAATVYFMGATDNTLTCNNTTDFYNIVLDKGIDQTFKLVVYSNAYDHFRLFGRNSEGGENGGANPDLRKALWIRTGTLELQGLTIIPSLTEGGGGGTPNSDFYIPVNGALVLNGSEVVVLSTADDYEEVKAAYNLTLGGTGSVNGVNKGTSASSFSIYGKLEINDGYFSTRECGGFVTWDLASGQFNINGGVVDAKQFRAASGSLGLSSYSQSGGEFILRGRFQRIPTKYDNVSDLVNAPINTTRTTTGLDGTKGSFNINNVANVFAMSGGKITIYDASGAGGKVFDVLASTANINVTGGTLEIIPTDGSGAEPTNLIITSNAELNNLTINRQSGTSNVQLSTYPLNVLSNLTLSSGTLLANNLNVTVGGDFLMDSGTAYTPGTNWTTFNGLGDQSFDINIVGALALNKFKLDKPAGATLTFKGTQSTISISDSLMILKGTLDDGGKTLNFAGTNSESYLYNSGIHSGTGKIVFNDNVPQLITGDGTGVFGNIELNNNTGTAPVYLGVSCTINGELTFSQDKLFNIGEYNLKLGSLASINNAGQNRYIRSDGKAGDGGITKVYSALASSFDFPIGAPSTSHASANYTPASLSFGTAPTSYGNVTVVPVGYEHPNTTSKNRSLTYFWRVKSESFNLGSATINHSYTYSENDVVDNGSDPTESEYIAAMYNNGSYTWTKETVADVNATTNVIGGIGTSYQVLNTIDGEFTAGDANPNDPFGTPTKFYSRANANWNVNSTWSNTGHIGAVASSTPGANDVVIIGNNNTVSLTKNENCASLQIEAGATLDIYTYTGSVFSIVLTHPNGNGLFRVTTPVTPNNSIPGFFTFPSGDFSDFNVNSGTTEFYDIDGTVGALYILPANITQYGNLIVTARGGDNLVMPNNAYTTIYGDLTCTGDATTAWIAMSWNTNIAPYWDNTAYNPTIEKTINIKGDLNIDAGSFEFFNDRAPQHLIVEGNVNVATGAVLEIYPAYPFVNPVVTNTLEIGGSLVNNNDVTLSAASDGNTYNIHTTFFGDNSASVTNNAGSPTTIFSNVTINKGSSQSDTLTIDIGGTLTTPTDNWLTLQNGTLKYSRINPSSDFTISRATQFIIPSTAGLYIDYPNNGTNRNILIANSNSNSNDLYLNGKLTVLAGNVYVGNTGNIRNNDIEYSGGGDATIDIQGGNLIVNGQVRRNPATTSGILNYTQSGGQVIINGQNALATNAKLEVCNVGSNFDMSGGSLTIVRGGGTTYGDLYIRAENSTVTGGEIIFTQLPNIGPIVNSVQNYILDANVPLNHLTITGKTAATARNATVTLLISPLTLNGDLTISNGNSIFDVNTNYDIDVTVKGGFTNNGFYNHYNNLTTFSGGVQSIQGSTATDFYDLLVDPVTSLSLIRDITIHNDLDLNSGQLLGSTFDINVEGNLINNANYDGDSIQGGVILNGSSIQSISGSGTFGRLEIDNASGARILNDVTLQKNLRLTTGILDINRYLFTLGVTSIIEGSSFGTTKMISSDGVFSDVGLRKYFNKYNDIADTLIYPIGTSGKYTPVDLRYTSNTNVGYIRINSINDNHPGVLDPDNVLDYFWEVESNGIAGFNGSFDFNYLEEDVQLTGVNTEADYIAAALHIPGSSWSKIDNVDESNNIITFDYSGVDNLSGEYTAGVDPALPLNVPEYTSINDGKWSVETNWAWTGGDAYDCPAGGPNGFIVTIASDDTITTDANYASAYRLSIEGKLKISSTSFGHNLGSVSGNGILYLENGTFPAGRFTDFLDCSNGATLEYGGASNYTIISDLYSSIPNLHFTGGGTRTLPNKDLTICTQLLIDGPDLDNSVNNRKLTIQGTMERYNTSTFISGSGAAATVSFAGSSAQTIGGVLGNFTGVNTLNNLEINNSSGLSINNGGSVEVKRNLLLTNGLISTAASNSLKITNTDINSVVPVGGNSGSYVDGPLIKDINQGDSFLYPIGKGTEIGNKITLSSVRNGTISWTAEYFTPNTTFNNYANPLTYVNSKDYWTVTASPADQAIIGLKWDDVSDLTPLMTENGLSDMRVADYNTGTEWTEIGSSASGDNNNGTVTTSSEISLPVGGSSDFTTACINITKPRARLNPTGAVCGADGIPVTFTYSAAIPFNYTLDYTIDGVAQPQITITSGEVPYTLTTLITGTYKLTAFSYNNGVNNGVVDQSEIIVYDNPTVANAGTDQSICGGTSATLDGNDPAPYAGLWTIISGAGGTVVTPTSSSSIFNGTNGTTYTLRWTITNGGCESSMDVVIDFPINPPVPAVFTASSAEVCQGQSGVVYTVPNDPGVTYNWSYSGSGHTINGTGNSVTLDFDNSATGGTLGVTSTNGCGISLPREIAINVNPIPTITLDDPNVQVCQGGTSVDLVYTASTGAPDLYSINFDAVAEGQGFADVSDVALIGSPISITVPGATNSGTYNGILTVANSIASCISTTYPITIQIDAIPAPTISGIDTTCVGNSLIYTTEGSMNNYVWTVDGTYGNVSLGAGTNSITVDWTNFTGIGTPTTINVTYDNAGCVPISDGAIDVMVFKIPETGNAYHIPEN